MLNNFISGGQVFLHKIRMFSQVFFTTFKLAMCVGILSSLLFNLGLIQKKDWKGFFSYRKAWVVSAFDMAINEMRISFGNESNYETLIEGTVSGLRMINMSPNYALTVPALKRADNDGWNVIYRVIIIGIVAGFFFFMIIFLLWDKLGRLLKTEITKGGNWGLLNAKEVAQKLKTLNKASNLKIGKMPLVKDSETKHFLVTGSTGSGKTNLIHNILPQIENNHQPAVIIDQTGEMIAKYYNEKRGDVIFNPFDERAKSWDFWTDCASIEDQERFSRILFSFGRKKSGHKADPFWEQSAEVVFNACVYHEKCKFQPSIEQLVDLARNTTLKTLKNLLKGSEASRYLEGENQATSGSILSILATSVKPLSYLKSTTNAPEQGEDKVDKNQINKNQKDSFSLKRHFASIKAGSDAWLFLSTKPSNRELTMPLISCLAELSLSLLMDIGIKNERRIWFVIDELASLGKLPALATLMSEGRKYGACVIAGLQSLNQIYDHYGHYEGSAILGQFGSSFFFRNNELAVAKMVSELCGQEIITRQQKNTSFGANEHRDGVSYSEHDQNKNLVQYSDLASLVVGECFCLLPEPAVRLSKIQTPEVQLINKNEGFVQIEDIKKTFNKSESYFASKDEVNNEGTKAAISTVEKTSESKKKDQEKTKEISNPTL